MRVHILCVRIFYCTFAVACIKARYDSRLSRSMETRLMLRFPQGLEILGAPIK